MHRPVSIPHNWIGSWPRRRDLLHRRTLAVRRVVVMWCEAGGGDSSQGNQPGS